MNVKAPRERNTGRQPEMVNSQGRLQRQDRFSKVATDAKGRITGSYDRTIEVRQNGARTNVSVKTKVSEYEKGKIKRTIEVEVKVTRDRGGEVRGSSRVTISDASGKVRHSSEHKISGGKYGPVSVRESHPDQSRDARTAQRVAQVELEATGHDVGFETDIGFSPSPELKMTVIDDRSHLTFQARHKTPPPRPEKKARSNDRPDKSPDGPYRGPSSREVHPRPEKQHRVPERLERPAPLSARPIQVPPNFDFEKNTVLAETLSKLPAILRFPAFAALVWRGNPWDYKQVFKRDGGFFGKAYQHKQSLQDVPAEYRNILGPGDIILNPYEDFGNYHYGYMGTAMGFTPEELHAAAGAFQVYTRTSRPEWQNSKYMGDDPGDYDMIERGISDRLRRRPISNGPFQDTFTPFGK